MYVGVITISMDTESEKILREMAKAKYGNRKDAISKTIIDSLKSQVYSRNEAVNRLKKAFSKNLKTKKGVNK